MPTRAEADLWGIHAGQSWARGDWPGDELRPDPVSGGYQVFDYSGCRQVLTDVASYSSDFGQYGPGPATDPLDRFITQLDPPLHTEVRRVLGSELRPSAVQALEPRISALVDECLGALQGRDEVDIVEELTYPVPVRVMTELIGLPRGDWPLYRRWVQGITDNFAVVASLDDPEGSRAALRAGEEQLEDFVAYLEEQVRRCPPSRRSLMGRLRAAELDGAVMDDRQVARFLLILLVAGHITTTMLVGSALVLLGHEPSLRREVLTEPSRLDDLLEETARLFSPFAALSRITRVPVHLGRCSLPAGTPVVVWVGAANRDERRFDCPNAFVPGRAQRSLSFGAGPHACPGAGLALTEGRIVLGRLLQAYPDLTIVDETVRFHPGANTCAVQDLRVRLQAKSG